MTRSGAGTRRRREALKRMVGALLACAPLFQAAQAATLSVGTGKPYATPCRAFAAAASGDTVEIAAGTYTGDVCAILVDHLVIRGVQGRPRIDAGGRNALGKGTWVVAGNQITIENVEMLGAKVPDRNGAALRLEGTGFTLRGSYLHDNENGILSGANGASDIVIETSEFGRNGDGTGQTHNVYIGTVRSLTFRYNYTHDAHVGHNLKSRAHTNKILYNRFSSSGLGQPSYEIDLPNGGLSWVIGNVIQQPAANQNAALLAYGAEGASNTSEQLYVVNNTFLNDDTMRGTFVQIGPTVTTPALVQNNVFVGTGAISNQASALLKTNLRSNTPGFVRRASFDLRPAPGSPMIDAGSTPPNAALAPVGAYRHVAAGMPRPLAGKLDSGAYEAGSPVP